jgi:pyruvate dehydrogenase E1 component
VTEKLASSHGPVVAVSDYMRLVPDQISRWSSPFQRPRRGRAPGTSAPRSFTSLGTDGYGRSDTREALRRFFEVDAPHVVIAVLSGLAASGDLAPGRVDDALSAYGIDADAAPSWHR